MGHTGTDVSIRGAAVAAERMGISSAEHVQALDGWLALVASGWRVVDEFDEEGRRFLVARRDRQSKLGGARLSQRELEVARLASLGHANKLIAFELGITVHSVGTYLLRVKAKLGLRSRLDLVRLMGAV